MGAILAAALCAAVAQAAPLALDTAALTNAWEEAGISAYKCRIAFRNFGKDIADANAEAAAKRTQLDTTARLHLKSRMEKAQAEGDLDRVLVFKSALESARGGAITGEDEAIMKLRESYDRQLALADKALLDAGFDAARAFAASLDEQKKEATKKGDLDDAQKIAAFQRKVGEWAKAVRGQATPVEVQRPPATPRPQPQPRPHRAGERKVIRIGSQEVALRWCPPGSFDMGAPNDKGNDDDEHPQHLVTLSKGFWLGETEVNQGLWKEIMEENPSINKAGDKYPVENVAWNDCQKFFRKLNAHPDVATSRLSFALPTEAQWEYACRAGTTSHNDDVGWYRSNSGDRTHSCGEKKPNDWALHDMLGNVWEWCQDWYGPDYYAKSPANDPMGPASGDHRVLRGCSFRDLGHGCPSTNRTRVKPDNRGRNIGFRLLALQDGQFEK